MVATLGATQRKNVLTTLEIPLINWDYQLLRLKIMLNGEIQSNHIEILQSSTLVVGESRTMNWIVSKFFQKFISGEKTGDYAVSLPNLKIILSFSNFLGS